MSNSNPPGGSVSPDTRAATDFLERWPCERWVLTSIHPEHRRTTTATFGPKTRDAAAKWIDTRQGKENIYFMVNPAIRDLNSKAKKTDVKGMIALHVDVDPRAGKTLKDEQERALRVLQEFIPPPSIIIFSGGGYQGFWLLNDEQKINGDQNRIEELEAYNRKIELDLQGDHCHNIDRIMRLPGTINVPDEKKCQKGRVPALAYVVEAKWTRRYSIDQFTPAPGKQTSSPTVASVNLSGDLPKLGSVEELPSSISNRIKAVIVQGDDPEDPTAYASRSEATFAVCCALVRAGVEDDTIASILLDPDYGISAHCLAQSRSKNYAKRQIERARESVEDSFETDKSGKPYSNSQRNVRIAIRRLGVKLHHDLFAERTIIEGLEGFGPALDDAAANRLWLLIDERFRFRPGKDFFHTVIGDHARQSAFHPIVEYLAGLRWDGVPRLDCWLVKYGGAEDTPYVRTVGRIVMVAAIRRVRQPGIKFDEMLVLESYQGTNKSTALKILAVNENWFSDDLPLNADTKRVIEALSGKWIVEASELKGMRKGQVEHLKSFLSRTHDKARMSYDRREREVARQCVIIGTTNDKQYLLDTTGNRRFWPVEVNEFDIAALRRDRDQLWAEAVALDDKGETIRLDPPLWEEAQIEQDHRRAEDPIFEKLQAVFGEELEGKIAARNVWLILGKLQGTATQEDNRRLGEAMRRLGFERKKRRYDGQGPENGYVRGEEPLQQIHLDTDDFGNVRGVYIREPKGGDPF